jgi:hypothetical protein
MRITMNDKLTSFSRASSFSSQWSSLYLHSHHAASQLCFTFWHHQRQFHCLYIWAFFFFVQLTTHLNSPRRNILITLNYSNSLLLSELPFFMLFCTILIESSVVGISKFPVSSHLEKRKGKKNTTKTFSHSLRRSFKEKSRKGAEHFVISYCRCVVESVKKAATMMLKTSTLLLIIWWCCWCFVDNNNKTRKKSEREKKEESFIFK